MGQYSAFGFLGPAIAFFAGAKALTIWVDGADQIPLGITIDHDLWIGNWWAMHICFGVLAIIVGLMITGIPAWVLNLS